MYARSVGTRQGSVYIQVGTRKLYELVKLALYPLSYGPLSRADRIRTCNHLGISPNVCKLIRSGRVPSRDTAIKSDVEIGTHKFQERATINLMPLPVWLQPHESG
jgi:hypothetical protein